MKRLTRTRSTFTTVIAGAAVLALFGTGTAVAGGLITSARIKNNTIKSIDVRNNNLTGTDILDGSLTGADVADSSLSNQDIGVLTATVAATGALHASSGGVTSSHLGTTGEYLVNFGRDVTQCAYLATVGDFNGGTPEGQITASNSSGNANAVFVKVEDSAGAVADASFYLAVVC